MLRKAVRQSTFSFCYSLAKLFQSRNLLYQHTSEMLEDVDFIKNKQALLNQGQVLSVYCGYDPTAESLHLGNLVSIVMMARLHKMLGLRPIFLLGGATGLIGDPSGKKQQRDLLAEERVNNNLASLRLEIEAVYNKIVGDMEKNHINYGINTVNGANIQPLFANNYDFYKDMNVLTYLRDVGKVLRMSNMLTKQIVSNRLQSESGLSYTQFSYSILQSYDFYRLNRDHCCLLQFGGSDQWGNITNGCDLTKKLSKGKLEGYGITMPLLLTKTGEKFGKSQGNALFLNGSKTPISLIYDYFYSTADDEVQKLLGIFTLYSPEKISHIMTDHKAKPQLRSAQKILAESVTNWLGSYRNLKQELMKTNQKDLKKKTAQQLEQIHTSLPQQMKGTISQSQFLSKFKFLPDILVEFGLCKSKNEARKDIEGQGAYLNNSKVPKNFAQVEISQIYKNYKLDGGYILFRKGKKKYFFLRVQP